MDKSAILIDTAVKEALDREAAFEGSSSSAIAEKVIGAYVRARDAKRMAIAQAVKEADAGIFVSGEAVDRWVESWGTDHELPMPQPDIFLPRI